MIDKRITSTVKTDLAKANPCQFERKEAQLTVEEIEFLDMTASLNKELYQNRVLGKSQFDG